MSKNLLFKIFFILLFVPQSDEFVQFEITFKKDPLLNICVNINVTFSYLIIAARIGK